MRQRDVGGYGRDMIRRKTYERRRDMKRAILIAAALTTGCAGDTPATCDDAIPVLYADNCKLYDSVTGADLAEPDALAQCQRDAGRVTDSCRGDWQSHIDCMLTSGGPQFSCAFCMETLKYWRWCEEG